MSRRILNHLTRRASERLYNSSAETKKSSMSTWKIVRERVGMCDAAAMLEEF
ncbi:MAG: hypothetical protein ACLP56_10590 [Candidatus Sulfotelmatobacter sp.]